MDGGIKGGGISLASGCWQVTTRRKRAFLGLPLLLVSPLLLVIAVGGCRSSASAPDPPAAQPSSSQGPSKRRTATARRNPRANGNRSAAGSTRKPRPVRQKPDRKPPERRNPPSPASRSASALTSRTPPVDRQAGRDPLEELGPRKPSPQQAPEKPTPAANALPRPNRWKPPISAERADALGIRFVEGQHVRLYTDLPQQAKIDDYPAAFDQGVALWAAYFGLPRERWKEWKISGYLIRDKQRFRRAGLLDPNLPPFLNGFQRGAEIWVYDQPSDYYRRHLLLHEGVHALMNQHLGGCGPPWFMEGMAELLATHQWNQGQLRIVRIPAHREAAEFWGRVKIIKQDYAAGRALSLQEVMSYGPRAHLRVEPYGWSWAACLFFDQTPEYAAPFRRLKASVDLGAAEFNAGFRRELAERWPRLQHQWQVYVAELEYGYDVARNALRLQKGGPLPKAGRTVEVRADRGWQDVGVQLSAGQRVRLSASGRFQLAAKPKIWWSEAGGVTVRYYRRQPLGILQAAIANLARVPDGESPLTRPQAIGDKGTVEVTTAGSLFLRVNDSPAERADNQGSLQVRIDLLSGE